MKNKVYLPDFLIIPSVVIQDPELTNTDGLVYGVVYWFVKLKNERCTLSNNQIAGLLNLKQGSIANSLSRLSKKQMVEIPLDENNHRTEIIPLITLRAPTSSNEGGSSENEGGVHSTVKHNNINNNKTNVNVANADKSKYYGQMLADKLHDQKSLKFYTMQAKKHNPGMLYQKACEIVADGGASNPGAVFTQWIKGLK